MKKTLLSMMTMAILASGSAYAAENIDIDVTAEIPNKLAITKNDDTELKDIKLTATPGSPGEYRYVQPIKITGNNSANKNFGISITKPLSLVHNVDSAVTFDINTVSLGSYNLQTTTNLVNTVHYPKDPTTHTVELDLVIVAQEPKAQNPGTYSGTLSLQIEETA
ncbi:TPA: hypothetical protein U5D21_002193 [Yersinia enterocolitica]|nr:hypothetical protein [Yersinia enterocolitica]